MKIDLTHEEIDELFDLIEDSDAGWTPVHQTILRKLQDVIDSRVYEVCKEDGVDTYVITEEPSRTAAYRVVKELENAPTSLTGNRYFYRIKEES
ncbi:hypothetical protein CPT_Mendera_250 [Stenotrophomonas phage Mendera]|uniref:Uncharacterized protein n=1 Tax=Stenotrophomonas phage Mendera TaxID=2650877 RepID=A0A5P8PJ67_9CAUD|nr:hypothetical protein HWC60_gp165 [Stenotrophomonas phage Mendera]QFR56776.1 hypothetical protein CPT_Mendera_250 [Stenotrophomonas phage Mendera]